MPSLILGGHSFISQLGSDPQPTSEEADALVRTCLDFGIRHFDTTYLPERVLLGSVLHRLGRRAEATLMAWNFFQPFDGNQQELKGPEPYTEERLQQMLDQLQVDSIDELVIHRMNDPQRDDEQERLALKWQQRGRVGRLGTWAPGPAFATWPRKRMYAFVVEPGNPFANEAATRFRLYAGEGCEVYACSPFVRGWQLDKLAERARHGASSHMPNVGLPAEASASAFPGPLKARVADHLLRFAAFLPHVSRLIVSMRQAAWVPANLESVGRGPLTPSEHAWLRSLIDAEPN